MDLNSFRLQPGDLQKIKPRKTPRSSKGRFLKGPIPLAWLEVASRLPGKSLHVGVCLWHAHGIERENRFKFSPKWHNWAGLTAKTLAKSLSRLQQAGLIHVEKYPGRAPVVTLLAAKEAPGDGD